MKTKDEVLAILKELGTTKADIIQNLVRLGIKGKRQSARSCPIANYLSSKEVMQYVSVHGNDLSLKIDDASPNVRWSQHCLMRHQYDFSSYPELLPIANFIISFDQGEIPILDC
jgi:hypothetical protein